MLKNLISGWQPLVVSWGSKVCNWLCFVEPLSVSPKIYVVSKMFNWQFHHWYSAFGSRSLHVFPCFLPAVSPCERFKRRRLVFVPCGVSQADLVLLAPAASAADGAAGDGHMENLCAWLWGGVRHRDFDIVDDFLNMEVFQSNGLRQLLDVWLAMSTSCLAIIWDDQCGEPSLNIILYILYICIHMYNMYM